MSEVTTGGAPPEVEEAVQHYRAGRLREALALCERRLRGGGDVMALTLAGIIHAQLDEPDLALPYLEQALVLDPGRVLALVNGARVLLALERQADAIVLLERLLEAEPDNVSALVHYGVALVRTGRSEEAEAGLRHAIELRPDLSEAHASLGYCLEKQGRYFDAEDSYRRAIDRTPGFVPGYKALGSLLLAQDRLDEAEAPLRRALALRPDHASAHVALGDLLAKRHRRDEAVGCYRRALALKPTHAEAYGRLCNLEPPEPFAGDAAGRTLVLVLHDGQQDRRDFEDIAGRIASLAAAVAVHLVTPRDSAAVVPEHAWNQPALTISFGHLGRFFPRRGPVLRSRPISKLEQYERYLAAGVETPRTERFEFGRPYHERDWGEFVVLKPIPLVLASLGNVHLYRTRRLASLRPDDLPAGHVARSAPMLVQSFVDSGPHPTKYRALMLLGRPLYIQEHVLDSPRADLGADDAAIEASIVATTGRERRHGHGAYPEIEAFARRMARCFPETPLLGFDIIRAGESGKIYALEANAGGNVWHFSSAMWAARRARMPEVVAAMHSQYGAFDVAAEAFAEAARTRAA